MFHMWDWGFGIGSFLMLFFWLFVAAIIVVVIVLVVNSTQQTHSRTSGVKSEGDEAIEIAKERYARGEINREEYKQLLEDLKE